MKTRRQTGQEKRSVRPPRVKGHIWRRSEAGWELRKLMTVNAVRKQRYVAYLSRKLYDEMRRKCRQPDALASALADWIAEREHEKGN